jgi:polysaccharide biosynthesis/export protein
MMTDSLKPFRLSLLALTALAGFAIQGAVAGENALGPDPVPTLAVPAQQTVPATRQPTSEYRLFPGDLLEVAVFDHPDLHRSIRVPNAGPISFPLIGDVNDIRGRSIADFSAELTRRLEARYLRRAPISITIHDYGPRFAYIMGSVVTPSSMPLDPFSNITAMQAISFSHGFLEDADRAASQVVREDPDKPGQKLALPIPAFDNAEAMAGDVVLQHGDIIIVPKRDRIYVFGQVNEPGAFSLPNQPLTVSKAISLGAGFGKYARKNAVQLIRVGQKVRVIDVSGILGGDLKEEDPLLRPGDTVFVPETRY